MHIAQRKAIDRCQYFVIVTQNVVTVFVFLFSIISVQLDLVPISLLPAQFSLTLSNSVFLRAERTSLQPYLASS